MEKKIKKIEDWETKADRIIRIIVIYFVGVYSAMYFCYTQPVDEHLNIINREINFPKQDCYTKTELEMIIYGQ
tara:strand:+ start:546 stop:764 length:219 start_codon:yes stop_codon:yes gene_type:complete